MDSTGTIDAESDIRIDANFYAQGASLLQQGRFADAATSLQCAVDSDPGDSSAWRLLGAALASAGDFAGAVPAFKEAVILTPADARNYHNLGVALQGTGRESEARAAFETSIRIDPSYPQARARIMALYGGARLAGAADPTGIYRSVGVPRTDSPDYGPDYGTATRSAGRAVAPHSPAIPPASIGL